MTSIDTLIREVFSLPVAQELLKQWKEQHCRKVFSSDPQRMARNAAISDFINDLEMTLNG